MRVAAEECKRCALLALVSLSFSICGVSKIIKMQMCISAWQENCTLCCGLWLQAGNPGWAPSSPAGPFSPPCALSMLLLTRCHQTSQASSQMSQLCPGLQPRHVLSATTVLLLASALGNWHTQWKHLKPSVPQNNYCSINTSLQSGFVCLHLTAISQRKEML